MEKNETKKSIYSLASLDGPFVCYFASKLQWNLFCKRSFCFSLKRIFYDPERLYFSMASSENKRASFEKKEREINIIYKL